MTEANTVVEQPQVAPAETKMIYLYDAEDRKRQLIGSQEIKSGDTLPDNATEIEPSPDPNKQYWNGSAWVGLVAVFGWDPEKDNEWTTTCMVPEGSALEANETYDPVPQGAYQPTKRVGDQWVSPTEEEWLKMQEAAQEQLYKEHPELAPKPTDTQLAMAQMGTQLATLTAENLKLKQDNAKLGQTVQALGMQVAQVVAKNGGTN